MISQEMLSLLAKAIAQKSKSFLRYGELARHLSDHEKFGQVLVEIILREQKHFETLSEIIPRLLESREQAPAWESAAENTDDEHQCIEVKNEADEQTDVVENKIKEKEVLNTTGDAGSMKIILLDLLQAKRSLGQRDDLGSPMPLAQEEKSIGGESVSGGRLAEEKMLAEAVFLEKQAAEEVQIHEEDNVPAEILVAEKMQAPEESQEHLPKETGSLFQQEEGFLEQGMPEQCPDAFPKESGLLVWTFGRTMKKGLVK